MTARRPFRKSSSPGSNFSKPLTVGFSGTFNLDRYVGPNPSFYNVLISNERAGHLSHRPDVEPLRAKRDRTATHSRFGGAMTTQRKSLPSTRAEKHQAADRYSPRRFPIQHEIQELPNELNAFNERIAELEDEGRRGHAMEVLKANALDFARQIDELRCLLVESARKHAPDGRVKRPFKKLSHR